MNANTQDNALVSWIALWNAIHNGTDEPRSDMSYLMQEVISRLSLYSLSYSFSDEAAAARARMVAVEGLDKLLPGLQPAFNG